MKSWLEDGQKENPVLRSVKGCSEARRQRAGRRRPEQAPPHRSQSGTLRIEDASPDPSSKSKSKGSRAPEFFHGLSQLFVADVWCRSEPQNVAPMIAEDMPRSKHFDEFFGPIRANGEKPGTSICRHGHHLGKAGIEIECLEPIFQDGDLATADLTQALGYEVPGV